MLPVRTSPPVSPAPPRRRRSRWPAWLPLLVLLAGAAGAVAVSLHWQGIVEREARTAFADATDETTGAVRAELARSEDALRGLRGLHVASDRVRRDEFHRYVQALDLGRRHPSMRGVSFVASVERHALARFVAARRRDGAPRFRVGTAPSEARPVAPSRDHRIVTFVEPRVTPGAQPGFDVRTRAGARAAQDRARDTGRATLTPRVILTGERVPGFGLYVPVYRPGAPTTTVAERRRAILGWLQARFEGNEFLAAIRGATAGRLRLELFDGRRAEPAALIGRVDGGAGTLRRSTRVFGAGHEWTLRHTASAAFADRHARREPGLVLVAGLVLSLLLAALVHSQTWARRRADQQVEQGTAELRHAAAELRRVNGELEDHNREVETFARLQRDFVATASHELRTPLTSIIGYLEIVLGSAPGELPDEQRGHLQVVWRSAHRLLSLVGDLLTVDRAESGVMEVHPLPVALGPLIAPAVHDLELACMAKGVRLTVGRIPSDLVVSADPDRFRQVLDNLIGNAIKFTPAAGEITIAARAAGGRAEITVADTGPGIPDDELPHVFDRFYRTSSTSRSAVQGTGLGLSIARALVEAHQGTLTAESVVGDGTTFTVSVPVAVAPASVGAPLR